MKILLLSLQLVVAGSVLLHSAARAETRQADSLEWRFEVYLDEKPIGFHEFRVTTMEERRRVETRARFDVKILFFNAYRYRHENVEYWSGDCLEAIEATTDDNGDRFVVTGRRQGASFQVTTNGSRDALPACTKSFAYWDPSFLTATRLLNSQTGELEAVNIERIGNESLRVGDEIMEAVLYEITVKDAPIRLWYARDDRRWLALETVAGGDRALRYQPRQIPPAPNDALAMAGQRR